VTKSGLSRREVALVAGALLLPIPLLATTGLSLPLPGLVERAVASLLPAAVSVTEPGAPAVAPGSQATPAGSATAGTPRSVRDITSRRREATDGAASGLARTTNGGSIGVNAPGTANPPTDGGTPSGGEPVPGADPGPQVIPAAEPLAPPDTVTSAAPDVVPDEPLPSAEPPVDVSVGENGAGIGSDAGASIDVTIDNGPAVDVGTPPLPPVPPVQVP
jgi:hypothetical protein